MQYHNKISDIKFKIFIQSFAFLKRKFFSDEDEYKNIMKKNDDISKIKMTDKDVTEQPLSIKF